MADELLIENAMIWGGRVAAYTIGGFQAIHGVAGSGLSVGAPADFVVVDGHPMSATSRVVETWIDGRVAWSAAA
jgi:imidazolonepropionase-like amidohydrolase